MNKYAVHLFPTDRVKVINIEAESVAEAIERAEASIDLHDVLDNRRPLIKDVEAVEWDEGQMYLQAAILKASSIDSYPDYAANIVKALPSGERWIKFIKPASMIQRESSAG
jgi:hypothetical protein